MAFADRGCRACNEETAANPPADQDGKIKAPPAVALTVVVGVELAILLAQMRHNSPVMARTRKSRTRNTTTGGTLPADLYDYAHPPARRVGRPAPEDTTTRTVTDDRPEDVPVTEAEIEVFEAWFGDLFDELFSTRH